MSFTRSKQMILNVEIEKAKIVILFVATNNPSLYQHSFYNALKLSHNPPTGKSKKAFGSRTRGSCVFGFTVTSNFLIISATAAFDWANANRIPLKKRDLFAFRLTVRISAQTKRSVLPKHCLGPSKKPRKAPLSL